MRKNIQILDCTLRDGGYVNDWAFGHNVITSIYRRLDTAGVEYIEVGFLDERRPEDLNRSIFPNTAALDRVYAGVEKKQAIPVAMIDFGTCSIDNIAPASESFIDGIRVIFKKEKIAQALPFCRAIKDKGYKLFIQAISITAYTDAEMLEYVEQINEIKPFAFSIVDTYGLLNNKTMARYFYLIDNNLDKDISIGYHEHNNFQLGFSNTLKFIGKDSDRLLVADSTVYGMGKSAGNCPTELLAMQLNAEYGKNYNLSEILEIIDTNVMPIYMKHFWGYKLDFYISAMQACHPNYVQFLLQKKTLSISSINDILSSIPTDKKLLYDKFWIENAYTQYQSNEINDYATVRFFEKMLVGKKRIMLIGPGTSYHEYVKMYKKSNDDAVIGVNFAPKDIMCDAVFISNAKRYTQFVDGTDRGKNKQPVVLTSNISPIAGEPCMLLNYASLVYPDERCKDNSLLLILRCLVSLGVKSVELVGFDGFRQSGPNYFEEGLSFNNLNIIDYNNIISRALTQMSKEIEIHFVTSTQYVISK